MTFTHGRSAYDNHGCRCPTCVEGARRYIADWRARRAGTLQPGDPRHGTTNGYENYACRCLACTEAKADHGRALKSRPAT